MTPAENAIVFENVSKFYGEVLGVNQVDLTLGPGLTSLVGPNGAGKTTLMNLMTGLLRPTQGRVRVLGLTPDTPEAFFRRIGYCAQFDAFPAGVTGRRFIVETLRLHGFDHARAAGLAEEAIARVGLADAADRKIAVYSKGMRQRIRLAQALAHRPTVLVLDEPLNGLDPMARAEAIDLFLALAREGLHVVLSSHVLHEVDRISDRVVMLSFGYVVAEGGIHDVRSEVTEHPMQVLVRAPQPHAVASRLFVHPHVVEVKVTSDGKGLLVRTRDADAFYRLVQRLIVEEGQEIDTVAPADDDVHSIYRYLVQADAEA
jgi:ABC-2 type transport system ATP-binding protein